MSTSMDGRRPVPQWDLGDRLAKSLKVGRMSMQQMADYLEVHRNTVGAWMNGRGKPPTRPILIAWALATGVPNDWLISGEGYGPSPGPDGPVPDPDGGMIPPIGMRITRPLVAA